MKEKIMSKIRFEEKLLKFKVFFGEQANRIFNGKIDFINNVIVDSELKLEVLQEIKNLTNYTINDYLKFSCNLDGACNYSWYCDCDVVAKVKQLFGADKNRKYKK